MHDITKARILNLILINCQEVYIVLEFFREWTRDILEKCENIILLNCRIFQRIRSFGLPHSFMILSEHKHSSNAEGMSGERKKCEK